MKLRNKILLSIGAVFIGFLALTYLGSRYILMRGFAHLEQEHITRNLERAKQALEEVDYSLYTFTTDWSHWNDLYSFMLGKNPNFVANNFTLAAFLNSTINLLTYWDSQGHLVVGTSIDTEKGKIHAFPPGLEKYLYAGSPLFIHPDINKDRRGFILLPHEIMMIAVSAITNGNKTSPPLGTTVSGRFLSQSIIQKISQTTQLNLSILLPDDIENNAGYKHIFQMVSTNASGQWIYPANDHTMEGFSVIRDINNKPIAMLRIVQPRSIYFTGLEAMHYYLTNLILLGIFFTILIIWLLRILVIERLERLDQDVEDIRNKHLLSKRVDATGNDELSSVAAGINNMLDTIQASHEKLEHRVAERTEELQKTNVKLEQEIIERRSVEEELITHKEHLVHLAHYDNLTTLPNRVFFNEILNKSLSHASRHNKQLAVLFIDLDRFKNINDALGHTIGDLVLKEIAIRFANVIRTEDMLARLGGDEFIVLLNDIEHPKFASPVAEKLLHICAQPIYVHNHEFFITASIGICIFPSDGASLEDLQRNADMAMYKAKKSGGNAYHYFTQEMNREAHEHIKLETALRKAIKNNEFVIHYQPKYNLSDGIITGVEALIRWESPEHGLISPGRFIPLAEETGLILPIGEWALREACRACKTWQQEGYQAITVAVNLSPKQFRHQNIGEVIANILAETGLESHYLEMEITETAVMDDIELAVTRLNEIHQMGVLIAIDDFGTGYTSINNLKLYPVSILKIDQNFIKGIPHDQNDSAITAAVIALAHNLKMKVVAEGVETPEQLQYLADHDCDTVQGYYLSRPLSESKLIPLLTKVSVNTEI